jgi:hypothetical protein
MVHNVVHPLRPPGDSLRQLLQVEAGDFPAQRHDAVIELARDGAERRVGGLLETDLHKTRNFDCGVLHGESSLPRIVIGRGR